MSKVLETTKPIFENSEHVTINDNKIDQFCKKFGYKKSTEWTLDSVFNIRKLSDEDIFNFLLVLHSNTFCYWGEPKWTIDYNGKMLDGTYGFVGAMRRAINNGMPLLDATFLQNLGENELDNILKGNTKIPLFTQRLEILREIGRNLNEKYHGSFKNMVEECNNDAMELLETVISTFPNFNDFSLYRGKKIFFFKRAQLLVSDVAEVFSELQMKNIDKLTVTADYKIPQTLRKLDILSYSRELARKVDNKILIEKDSQQELEIRSNTVWSIEMIKKKLVEIGVLANSIDIGNSLWLVGQNKSPDDKPYHRTLSTFY